MIPIKQLKGVMLAIGGVLLLRADSLAAPTEMAYLGRLFRGEGELSSEVAKDNIRECTPTVRRSITRIKSDWGTFNFTCINGVVRNMFVHPASPINKKPGQFISENLGIFDLMGTSTTVRFDGDKGTQFFRNDPIPEALIFRVLKDGVIPTSGRTNLVQPVSTRDLEHPAGEKDAHYVGFEFGLTDPVDGKVRINPVPGSK